VSEQAISDDERTIALTYLPPVVYLPCAKVSGPQGPEVEMRPLADGRVVLLAYTALDRLARSLGPNQPWIACPVDQLGAIQERLGYDTVCFDLGLPPEMWHEAEDVDE